MTSTALSVYSACRDARAHTVPCRRTLHGGMLCSLNAIKAAERRVGGSDRTSSTLLRLDAEPPPPLWPPGLSPERKVYEWAFLCTIAELREFRRAGYPVNLARNYSGLDLVHLCWQVRADYPRWLCTNGLSEGLDAAQVAAVMAGTDNYPLPRNGVLRWLCTRNLGPWSVCAREFNFVESNDWLLGHTLPIGRSVVASLPRERYDELRVAYDLARLNLAALLYRRAHDRWPGSPADLVPAFLSAEPPDPGPHGPYLWSEERVRFEIRSVPEKIWIL